MSRITHLIGSAGSGSAERVFLELTLGLRSAGLDVVPVTLGSGWLTEQLTENGFVHHQIPSRGGFDPLLPLRVRALIKKSGSELLHSHTLRANFYGAFAAKLAGVRHIATESGEAHRHENKSKVENYLRWMSRMGTELCAASTYTARYLEELGFPRIQVIGSPIRPAAVTEALRVETRRSLKVGDEWIWLHTASNRPLRETETVLRGFHLASSRAEHQQILVIAGEQGAKTKLESLAAELGVTQQLRFADEHHQQTALLSAADGFILSSLSDGLPYSILEAGAVGLYVIGSAAGAVSELIGSGRGGVFQPQDFEGLGREIQGALRSKEETKRKAASLKSHILERHSVNAIVQLYLKAYRQKS